MAISLDQGNPGGKIQNCSVKWWAHCQNTR